MIQTSIPTASPSVTPTERALMGRLRQVQHADWQIPGSEAELLDLSRRVIDRFGTGVAEYMTQDANDRGVTTALVLVGHHCQVRLRTGGQVHPDFASVQAQGMPFGQSFIEVLDTGGQELFSIRCTLPDPSVGRVLA